MPAWLVIQLVSIASMPAVYDLARDRGRSTRAWLDAALIIEPLALLALLLLDGRRTNTDTASFPMPVPIQTSGRTTSDIHVRDIVHVRRCHGETRLADLGWHHG
jgi:hypothetical protein